MEKHKRYQNIKLKRYEKTAVGRLFAKVKHSGQEWEDLGLISEAVITNAFIALLISVLQNGAAADLQSMKFHAAGTDGTAESAAQVVLGAQVGSRVVGSQTSTGAGNYRSVASVTFAAPGNIQEHGLFSQAIGGVLMDRSVFAAIPVAPGSIIQFTYDLTIAGS